MEAPAANFGAVGGRYVLRELGQDRAEMSFAEDQHVIQALAAERAHEPFRVSVVPHRQLHPIKMIDTVGSG